MGGIREELEAELRTLSDRGDHTAAAGLAVRGYGPEIYGFLVGVTRSQDDASEIFSAFTERMWRGLARFGWECSFRTWAYTIARNTAHSYRASARRRARRESPLPEGSALSAIVEEVKTRTRSSLSTQAKTRVDALRSSLSEADRMLLSLRVDRRLSFRDLAIVLSDAEGPIAEAELTREAARLRKRFQLLKERLTEAAKREGIRRERADGG